MQDKPQVIFRKLWVYHPLYFCYFCSLNFIISLSFCRKEPLMFQQRLQLYQLAAVVYSCHQPWCPSCLQQHQIQVCFKQSACRLNRICIRFIKPRNPFSMFITAGSVPQGTADRAPFTVQTLLDKLMVSGQNNVVCIVNEKSFFLASFSAFINLILFFSFFVVKNE